MSLSLPTEPCKVVLASVNPRREPRPVVLGQPLTSFSTAPCATNRETGLERERDLLKSQNPCSVFQSDRNLTQQRLSPRPQPRSSPGPPLHLRELSAQLDSVQPQNPRLSPASATSVDDGRARQRAVVVPPGATRVRPHTHPLKPAQQGQHPYFAPPPARGAWAEAAYSRPKSSR